MNKNKITMAAAVAVAGILTLAVLAAISATNQAFAQVVIGGKGGTPGLGMPGGTPGKGGPGGSSGSNHHGANGSSHNGHVP